MSPSWVFALFKNCKPVNICVNTLCVHTSLSVHCELHFLFIWMKLLSNSMSGTIIHSSGLPSLTHCQWDCQMAIVFLLLHFTLCSSLLHVAKIYDPSKRLPVCTFPNLILKPLSRSWNWVHLFHLPETERLLKFSAKQVYSWQ